MIAYEALIRDELHGDTPKARYDNLMLMKKILRQIAYPRRGTSEETYALQDFADEIQQVLGREKLGEA
jgi:hypothetical protein